MYTCITGISLNHFLVSVQDIITVTTNTLSNTIIFTFDTTIDDTTPVTVTLSPNVMGEGSIGGGVVISGLMPDTLYTYTVSVVYNNISYSIQSSVTTLTAPTTAFQSSIGMDDIKQGTKFTVANLFSIIIYFKLFVWLIKFPLAISLRYS